MGDAHSVWQPPAVMPCLSPAPKTDHTGERGRGGGEWHKALVVGSVSLWRRLLASRP